MCFMYFIVGGFDIKMFVASKSDPLYVIVVTVGGASKCSINFHSEGLRWKGEGERVEIEGIIDALNVTSVKNLNGIKS